MNPREMWRHPVELVKVLWPHYLVYDKQKQVMESVRDFHDTLVPAANMMGKDWVTALIILWFFLTRDPCRVVFTSVDGSQLSGVLWGEIRSHIQQCKFPLDHESGGPLIVNHMQLRRVGSPLSYAIGRVAARGEGMLGHHVARTGDGIPRTLFVSDEASGVDDVSWERADTWAARKLAIGNPYECENFFKRGVQEGSTRHRNVIRIRAEDSPNVRYALAEARLGRKPSGKMLIPGILPYEDYCLRRETWDVQRQTVGLDALFYEGEEVLMFPSDWLAASRRNFLELPRVRKAHSVGVDPGDVNTVATAVDKLGVVKQHKMSNRSSNVGELIAFLHEVGCTQNTHMDRGGGGMLLAGELRARGYFVHTVGFGEPVVPELKRGRYQFGERVDQREDKYVFKNKRAMLFGELREEVRHGFAIYDDETMRQLNKFPLLYDGEGRLVLPPKRGKTPEEDSLIKRIGCSPDEADSLALGVHGVLHKPTRSVAGAAT